MYTDPSKTSFSPQAREAPEFTILNGIYKTHIVNLESQTLFGTHPLKQLVPVSFGQIDLGQVFLATELMEQVVSRRGSEHVVMGSGSTLVILFNFLKSTHTLLEPSFFLTMTMGNA